MLLPFAIIRLGNASRSQYDCMHAEDARVSCEIACWGSASDITSPSSQAAMRHESVAWRWRASYGRCLQRATAERDPVPQAGLLVKRLPDSPRT